MAECRAGLASRISLPTLLGIVAILLWSTTLPVARSLAEQIGALTAAACVNGIGGIATLAISVRLHGRHPEAKDRFRAGYLLACGTLFVLYFALLHGGLGLAGSRLQALAVGLMNYLWPSLTLLLSVPLLGVPSRWGLLAPGIVCATVGVGFVLSSAASVSLTAAASDGLGDPWPYVLGASAAVAWALYSNLSRRLGGSTRRSAVGYFMVATSVVLFAMQMGFAEAHHWSARVYAELAAMSVVSTTGYWCWDVAMRRGDVPLVATFSYLTPVLSTLFGTLYLGVLPGAQLWIGCGLIVGAAFVCRLATRPRPSGRGSQDVTREVHG